MSTRSRETESLPTPAEQKRPYRSPKLTEFGKIEELVDRAQSVARRPFRHSLYPPEIAPSGSRTSQVAYGVRVDGDIVVDGLPQPSGDEIAAVRVVADQTLRTQSTSAPADVEIDVYGHPLRLHANGGLDIRWGEKAYFRMAVGEPHILCDYGPDGSAVDMQQWMLHYALPLHLLIERHLEFLHGGCVQVGDGAVAFLAASGVGKSTLVDYFARRGHGFLTDDKLGIARSAGRFVAVPSTPFLCTDEEKLHWERVANYVTQPLPLRAIYLLSPTEPTAEPMAHPVPAAEAPFALACRCELRVPPPIRARLHLQAPEIANFKLYTAMASQIRVRRLAVPRALGRLPDVYSAVLDDLERGG